MFVGLNLIKNPANVALSIVFRQTEENHIMENIIFNELVIRGYKVDVGVVTISEKNEKQCHLTR